MVFYYFNSIFPQAFSTASLADAEALSTTTVNFDFNSPFQSSFISRDFFLMILFWKPGNEDQKTLILMLTGIGAILGHNFPILPGVKGGKGVACTGALLIALAPLYTLGLLCFFILIVLTTKYVSLGSVLSVFVFFFSVLLMGKSGILFPFSEAIYLPMCGLSMFLALLCLFQHRENVKRLLNGTENKFGKKK